jgi:hypothetical protein
MSQLTINDLNHYQSISPKEVIVGGQTQRVSATVAAAINARVTRRSINAGLGFGVAGAVGSNANTGAAAGVIIF